MNRHHRQHHKPRRMGEDPNKTRQLVLDTISGIHADEPLTVKGIASRANLDVKLVQEHVTKLVHSKQINQRWLAEYQVHAYYRKY